MSDPPPSVLPRSSHPTATLDPFGLDPHRDARSLQDASPLRPARATAKASHVASAAPVYPYSASASHPGVMVACPELLQAAYPGQFFCCIIAELTPVGEGEMRASLAMEVRTDVGMLSVELETDAARRLLVRVRHHYAEHASLDGEPELLTPLFSSPVPRRRGDERQSLRAVFEDGRLLVLVDGRAVWGGILPTHGGARGDDRF